MRKYGHKCLKLVARRRCKKYIIPVMTDVRWLANIIIEKKLLSMLTVRVYCSTFSRAGTSLSHKTEANSRSENFIQIFFYYMTMNPALPTEGRVWWINEKSNSPGPKTSHSSDYTKPDTACGRSRLYLPLIPNSYRLVYQLL